MESEQPIERPKMKERKSFLGNLKNKINETRKGKTKKIEVKDNDEPPVLRQAVPSTATRPSHPSVLSSYELEELRVFCEQSQIDYKQYEGHPNERKLLVAALAETYPPDPVRHYYLRMCELEEYVENFKNQLSEYKKRKEQAKQENIPFTEKSPTHSEEIMQEVNDLFHMLLTKFDVPDTIKAKLMKSFSIIEKIKHIRNSVW